MRYPRPATTRLHLVVTILAGVLALAACAQAAATPGAPSRPASRTTESARPAPTVDASSMVWMGDHYFSPSRMIVKVGTTVTWRMLGNQEHDVWSLDGTFHSPTMGPGATYSHTFTKAGTFKYICLPHNGDGMYGEVVVEP